jgi:integrase
VAYIRKYKDKWRAEIERNGIRSSKVHDTKREAQAWALEQEATAKRARAGGNKSFGDAVDKYKADVSSKKDGEVWEVRRLETMREYFGSNAGLLDIDTPQIAQWRDDRLKTVSASTVVREANLLRNLFNLARKEWKWQDHDPFMGVKLPKENDPRHQVWTWQLIKRVLRAPRAGKTAEMQDAFHIALRTAMRLAEVLKAPANFDPKRKVVTLKTKTEAMARVPIGRIAAKLLVRPAFEVGPNEGSTLFAKLCKDLLIEGLTFHDSRGTALTHLARKVDVLTLAKISRHKNLSLLSNVYYRETPDSIAARI